MNTKFNSTIVETSGVRTLAGGGTNANTATGALANLGGYPASNPSGYITGVFQPNPDYVSIPDISAKADAPMGSLNRVSSILYSDGEFPGNDVSYGLAYGNTYAGQASKWNYIYRNSDSVYIVLGTAVVTGGEYPWNVSYNNGVVVTKEAAARLISTLSGSASEGSSIYAARADHVHPFPTASEVGAYSINNPSGFISGVSQFNYISGDLTGGLLSPTLSHIQGNAISAASPSAGQTLQWNGTAWVPGSIPNGGNGGGGLVYYLNYQNTTGISPTTGLPTSPVSVSQLGRNYSIGSGSITSANLTNGSYSLVCGFVTIVGEPNVTEIPAGLWDFNIWADVSASSGAQTQFQIRIYKYDSIAGTYTSIANSDDIYIYDPSTITQYIGNVTMPQTTLLVTDRIYIELWAQKNVTGTRQVSFYFNSLHPSHCHTTLPSVSGNGVVKVINGVMQSPASTIIDADISASAGIQQSKIDGLSTTFAGKITNGGGIPKIIELTEAEYAALTSLQVDQTATYLVKGNSTQNSTSYEGKEFGGLKPVTLLAQPVVVGSVNRVSPTISIASVDWIQVSPIDPTKFYFSQNIGGGALSAMWRGTLTRDSANRISGGTNSYGGQQSLTFSIFNGTKGGGIYDADTVFIPDEKNSAGDSTGFGRIVKVDLATSTTTDAWNFQTSTPAVVRADIASQLWYPDDCIVDRVNNKLFVGSGSISTNTNGSSVARFSIDPTTKVLTPDSWVKAVTPDGSGINFVRRLTLLPDGYIFVSNFNLSTNTPSFQTFNAYGDASGNATSVEILYAPTNIVQGVAFKPDTNAPSGIGYILIAPRAGTRRGRIFAYDYQGAGVVNTSSIDDINLTTIGKNAGLYTNTLNLEIGAIAVAPDGAILVGLRSTTTTPIPRSVIAFNWVPYAKSGTLSTQNLDNVSITGGSIYGVRNLAPKVEYITSSRSWWKDEFAKFIRVQAWSGGGGGGSGRKDSTATVVRSGGGGGGGGGYIDVLMDATTINTATVPVTITIGGGGAGGASQTLSSTDGNNGTQGGNTSWNSVLIVLGGSGGFGGSLTGANGGTGSLNGNAGGAAAADGFGLSGFPGSIVAPVGVGGVGGGSGGGLNASNAMFAGGVGGISFYGVLGTAAAGGTTSGGNGAAGNNTTTGIYQVGGGGGGGGAHTTGNGGSGGVGGFGSGGGGGGASQNGNSGAGGDGGNGFMIVTTYY